MLDKFLFKCILSKTVVIENNSSKHKDYRANLVENNNKNSLHYAIRSANIDESKILSGCIYTNVNKSRQNSYWKLIFAIYHLSNDNVAEDHNNNPRPIISYNLHSDGKFLND